MAMHRRGQSHWHARYGLVLHSCRDTGVGEHGRGSGNG